MTMVDPAAAPAPTTAYGIPYITLSNIAWSATNNAFTVTCTTDVACMIQMDYWSQNDPSIPQPIAGTVAEAGPVTRHTFTTPALPGVVGSHAGKVFGFSLRIDANDTTGLTLRSQQGWVQLIGARAYAGQTLPVRFYTFGNGTPPPPSGGGGNGNWSSYTWAQYNPKGN
jgi:hypothetical protein